MSYLEHHCFKKRDDGTYEKAVCVIETIDELMELAIIDVKIAKGPGQVDDIINSVKEALDVILKDDEVSKDLCVRLLKDPDDIMVLNEMQRTAPNRELMMFANNYGYEQGIKAISN